MNDDDKIVVVVVGIKYLWINNRSTSSDASKSD